jgi:hypothetical protein
VLSSYDMLCISISIFLFACAAISSLALIAMSASTSSNQTITESNPKSIMNGNRLIVWISLCIAVSLVLWLIHQTLFKNESTLNAEFIVLSGILSSSGLLLALDAFKNTRLFIKWESVPTELLFICFGFILHLISLFSKSMIHVWIIKQCLGSSTVEEEHQTWYFLVTTMYLILVFQYSHQYYSKWNALPWV